MIVEQTTDVTMQRVGADYYVYVWSGTKLLHKIHTASLAEAYRIAYSY